VNPFAAIAGLGLVVAVGTAVVAWWRGDAPEPTAPSSATKDAPPKALPGPTGPNTTTNAPKATTTSDDRASNIAARYGIAAPLAKAVVDVADSLGARADDLAAVIWFESGRTFRPDARHPTSGATGLIQFMPSSAQRLGTTTELLARMTAEQQLRGPVREYLRRVKEGEWWDGSVYARNASSPYPPHPIADLQSLAMSVFFPWARPALRLDEPLPANVQTANPGIRTARDYLAKLLRVQPGVAA
jgi:hypothetical protein